MPDEKELVEIVKRVYDELSARYIKEEELFVWLEKNGLILEEAKQAIHLAMKQHIIRFCYPSSVGGKELVPCYERITEEDLLPLEILQEMRKKIMQKELRATKTRKSQAK